MRKSQLEEYLGNILNDPAYLTSYSLKFINCDIEINRILMLIPIANVYDLILPISWEGDIDSDSNHFIVYNLRFRKHIGGMTKE